MLTTRRLVLGAGLGTFAVGRGTSFAQGSGPIRIATAGPMTGQYAAFGTQMREGATQAVTDINAAGGVLGRQLALEIGDDACDPRQAVSVANQLAARRVVMVAGHFCSGSSSRRATSMPRKACCRSAPPPPIRASPTKASGTPSAPAAATTSRARWPAPISRATCATGRSPSSTTTNAYGKGLADETRKAMNAAGMQEAMYAAYTPGERDYNALVSRMKAANIDVIYLGGYHHEAASSSARPRSRG